MGCLKIVKVIGTPHSHPNMVKTQQNYLSEYGKPQKKVPLPPSAAPPLELN